MERYFEVTGKSDLYNEYLAYKNSQKVLHYISTQFMSVYGIETDGYANQGNTFYIEPTENDLEKFGKSLCKPLSNDLRAFKANSKIGKAWVQTLEEKQVKIKSKPFVGFSFKNCMGKNRSRIFAIDNSVYCSFSNEYDFNDTPDGFIEIKASEFYKIIEDHNNKVNSNPESSL